jgi:hypothetical protein
VFTTNNKKYLWMLVCVFTLLGICAPGGLTSAQMYHVGATDATTDVFISPDNLAGQTDSVAVLTLSDWDLPAPNHSLDFGYYFVDHPRYGDYWNEVNHYTNLYMAGGTDMPDWQNRLRISLQRAVEEDKSIYLSLGMPNAKDDNGNDIDPYAYIPTIAAILDVAVPYWNKIKYIELADEPDWGVGAPLPYKEINLRIEIFERVRVEKGLPQGPLVGIVYTPDQITKTIENECGLPNRITRSNLDWLGVMAYLDPPGDDDSAVNIQQLNELIDEAKCKTVHETEQGRVEKNLILVMQAYDRNGHWHNIDALVDLQAPVYLRAYGDPRVVAITMFAYARPGGTRDHPELKVPHQAIWSAISASSGEPPAAPSNLTAHSPVGLKSWVDLNWRDNSYNENWFVIHRRTVSGEDWSYLGLVAPNETHYVDKTADPPGSGSRTYCYRVRAVNSAGRSEFSSEACVTMYSEPPGKPTLQGPAGCIDTLRPSFSWSSVPRVNDYWFVCLHVPRENFAADDSIKGTSYTLTSDLLAGEEYRCKVKAKNNAGGVWSDMIYFTPLCDFTDHPVLLDPPPGSCIDTQTPLLSWTSLPGATYYQPAVSLCWGDGPFFAIPATTELSMQLPFPLHLKDTGEEYELEPGQEYRFKVKGTNPTTDGTYSHMRFFTYMCDGRPGSASPLSPWGTLSTTMPIYSWEVGTDVTEYALNISTRPAADLVFQQWYSATNVCDGLTCSVTPAFPLPNGDYYWSVNTRNSLGYGRVAFEHWITIEAPSPPPDLNTPAGLNVVSYPSDQVTMTHDVVLEAGTTAVTPITPDLAYILYPEYAPIGVAYEITTTARFGGPVTLDFAVPTITDEETFSNLRVLHEEDGVLVDSTLGEPNFAHRTVSARVYSLSPFVIVKEIDPPLPVAHAQHATTTMNAPITLTLTGSAACEAPTNPIRLSTRPAHGTLVAGTIISSTSWGVFDGTSIDVTYVPALGFVGGDRFTFRIDDSAHISEPATVTITVNGYRLFMPLALKERR